MALVPAVGSLQRRSADFPLVQPQSLVGALNDAQRNKPTAMTMAESAMLKAGQ
jgi:hypothetical protein